MRHAVLGFFRNQDDAKTAKSRLLDSGFVSANIDYSPYSSTGEYNEYDYEYQEDEETKGFWASLFGNDENERKKYSRLGSRTNVLTVYTDTDEEARKAQTIMDELGSVDADEYDHILSEYNKRYKGEKHSKADFDRNFEVIKEELSVGKKEVETGGVKLRSRIVERPVVENIRLKNERVYVKRNKVNRPVDSDRIDDFYEGTIEMTETEERPVVSKDARVVEEISIGKEVDVENRKISDTVKETEVEIEREGSAHHKV